MGSTMSKKGFGSQKKVLERPINSRRQTLKVEPKQGEIIDEIEEEEVSFDIDDSNAEDTFIQMDRLGDIEKDKVDKSQLVEYDAFYKEQFFKNELFNYDVEDIKDKEVEEINHEMNKLEAHRKLLAKRKEKDAQEKKGLNTTELQQQIEILEKELEEKKEKEEKEKKEWEEKMKKEQKELEKQKEKEQKELEEKKKKEEKEQKEWEKKWEKEQKELEKQKKKEQKEWEEKKKWKRERI